MKLNIFVFLCVAVALSNAAQSSKKWMTPMEQTLNNGPKASGTTSISGHIIAGTPAVLGQFPWQAALSITKPAGTYLCGGILIDPLWVLTAGHCTIGATSILVRLGTLIRTSPYIASASIITHENYSSVNLNNDLGLIKLSVPANVTTGSNIKAIKLVPIKTTFTNLTVSGWGKTCDNCTSSATLNYAIVKAITNAQCASYYGTSTVTNNSVCTMGFTKQSTCFGDSGGPLILNGTIPYVVGVVSFVSSLGCEAGYPAGYIRIANFCPWLKGQITGFVC